MMDAWFTPMARLLAAHRLQPVLPDLQAAVAAVLRTGAEGTEVLLIERALRVGDRWSGQVSLPGGRANATDTDLVATAVRETSEEVGLDLGTHGRLLGALPVRPAMAAGRRLELTITPFVYALVREPILTPAAAEVASVFWFPLEAARDGRWDGRHLVVHDGRENALPCWRYEGRGIWGLTHAMLSELVALREKGQER
jgi:8-oxo-dGTP pyrophosphatase MutT (NUDIX family)